jgi:iron complex outermembrane receptor protein
MNMKLFSNNRSFSRAFSFNFIFSLFLLPMIAQAQVKLLISGIIMDSSGHRITHATIENLNTIHNVVSNDTGFFSIEVSPNKGSVISVSATGYATQLIRLNDGDFNGIARKIVLKEQFNTLDEVLVSAEKRDEQAQHEPISISVMNSRQVRDFRIWDLSNLSGLAPNVYSANPGDDRNVTSIRGITTTSYDPAVATYIDGVNQISMDTYLSPLLDVERIEILRGPQGTLYGRNAMGGVINVITKKPTNATRVFGEISFGNYNTLRANAGFSTALIKDKLFAGISLQYDTRHGYYINDHTGSDFDRQKTVTGNYYLKYLPGKDWSIQLNVHHNNNRNNGAFPLAVDPSTVFSMPYRVDQNSLATMHDDGANASLSVYHDGKKVRFVSQTAYQTNYRIYDQPLDADFTSLDAIRIFNNYGLEYNRVRAWTQEFRLNSVVDERKFSWNAGAYFFDQQSPSRQATQFGPDAPLLGIPDTGIAIITTNRAGSKGLALYGQATYRISTYFDLIGGLRWDYENKSNLIRGEFQMMPGPPLIIRPDTSASANFQAISPKLSLNWHPTTDNLVYFSYNRGFRTGGISPLSSDPSQPPLQAYAPEFSNGFELGSKNESHDHRFRWNATIFYTAVRDVQIPTLLLPDAVTITRNAGSLNSTGFELEAQAIPIQGLEIQAQVGHTDARYKTLRLNENYDGNRQIFTPAWNAMLATQYGHSISKRSKSRMVLRGEAIYTGEQYFDLKNTISQKAHLLINARASLYTGKMEFSIWGRNLGSVKYISYAYDFGGMHLGNPLTWGLTVRFQLD